MKLNQNKFLYGEMEDKKLKPFLLAMVVEWVEQPQTIKKPLSSTKGLQAKSHEVDMNKFQQETAVLLISTVILFAEFKTTTLGVLMLIFMACFVVSSWGNRK